MMLHFIFEHSLLQISPESVEVNSNSKILHWFIHIHTSLRTKLVPLVIGFQAWKFEFQ
jgi:hypothetical protein